MKVMLWLVTIGDLALGVLLIAVSGMMFQGVNNTGPMPGASLFALALIFCFVAPVMGWMAVKRRGVNVAAGIAALPLILGVLVLLSDG
jgi:hypothetical protein